MKEYRIATIELAQAAKRVLEMLDYYEAGGLVNEDDRRERVEALRKAIYTTRADIDLLGVNKPNDDLVERGIG